MQKISIRGKNMKLGRKPIEYEVRYCKNCTGEIPKNSGESIKRYNIKEFCCRSCTLDSMRVELKCKYCGKYFKIGRYKAKTTDFCPKCNKKILKGATKCHSDSCYNIMDNYSPIKWGRREFCTPMCLQDHLEKLDIPARFCETCGEILISSSGCAASYLKTKNHKNCELFKKALVILKREKYNKK